MEYSKVYENNKIKYDCIKNISYGGVFIKDTQKAVMYTKNTFDNFDEKTKDDFPYYCPTEYPYLCTERTRSVGLCKASPNDCDNLNKLGAIPLINVEEEKSGARYGYRTDTLTRKCNEFKLNYEYSLTDDLEIPKTFSIMTCNLMGILRKGDNEDKYKFEYKLLKLRIKLLSKEIRKENPDIICFQEVSDPAYKLLFKKISDDYKYVYERIFAIEKVKDQRNHDVEVMIFSKYQAQNVKLYSIGGSLSYDCSMLVAKFLNLTVYNCYLQAGSKHSVGQKHYWYHYMRCRMNQLFEIKTMIDNEFKENEKRPVIVTGDFNFHLDGPDEEWPELSVIDNFLKDAWKKLNPNYLETEEGFTENTDINTMRWNMKFQKKKLRYDGLLYNGNLEPISVNVVAKKPIEINNDLSKKFIKYWSVPGHEKDLKYYNKEKETLALFVSDHFPVIGKFKFI